VTVEKRLGRAANKGPKRLEYKLIEADEIDRFRLALQARIHSEHGDRGQRLRKVVELKEKPALSNCGS
jgi:hypothetical protein